MLLTRDTLQSDLRYTEQSNGAGTDGRDGQSEQSDEVRVPMRDVAADVLDSLPTDRPTTTQASLAAFLSRGTTFTNGGVRYDPNSDELHADGRELRVRVERQPAAWLTWTNYYLVVAAAAFGTIDGEWIGLYTLPSGTTSTVLLGALVLLLFGAAYQRYTRLDVPVGTHRRTE